MTYTLLATMVGVYVLELLTIAAMASQELFAWIFVINVDWYARPWSLVTSTLSHDPSTLMHLLFNGIFLYFFGPALEQFLGARRFVTLFMIAGALSGVTQVYLQALVGPSAGALGASGALMCLMGLSIVLTPKAKVLFYFFIPLPLWVVGIFYAFLDVIGAFNPNDHVGNFAHLSGLALGLLYGWWMRWKLKRSGLRITY